MIWTLVGLVVRSALVLLFTQVFCRSTRTSPPAYRHAVLVAGFGTLLFWPLFSYVVPAVYVPLVRAGGTRGAVTVQMTIRTESGSGHVSRQVVVAVGLWVLGTICCLLPLITGHLRVFQLKRRGMPIPESESRVLHEWMEVAGLSRLPEILIFPERVMPQTFGILRPCILLPPSWASWAPLRKRAVLLHELAHVKRRDTAWQLLVNLIVALWWFQPLCWIGRRAVRAESEQACDALVVASGLQPSVYAAELLAIAEIFRPCHRSPANALPIVDPSSLRARLHSILNGPDPSTPKRSAVGAVLLLICWAAVCSAVSVARDGQMISEGGVSMKRTLFARMSPGLLTSASLSAAAIGGSILDPSGAAILNAKASLYNPDTKARQELTSMADGRFEFDNLAAGQYILRVEKPGFSPVLRAFAVGQNTTVDRGLTLRSGSESAASNGGGDSITNAPGQRPVRIGGQVAQTNLVDKVQPVYPSAAKSAGVQGTVLLEAVISAEGAPQEIRVVSSPSEDLSQSALEAVRQWRYRPVLLNGNPVDVVTDIVVSYTLAP